MDKNNKIIFFGTGNFALAVLKSLITSNYNIAAVITQPNKPQGRHQKIVKDDLVKFAENQKIKLLQPVKLNIEDIKNIHAAIGILVSYGRIIPENIINFYSLGILNIHPSLLPKYRGPSPIQSALLNRDQYTGVSIIKLSKKLDAGPIVAQKKIIINQKDDYLTLSDKLAKNGAQLLIEILAIYPKIELTAQNDELATFSKIIEKSDGLISLKHKPEIIMAKLKAFKKWPGIFFIYNNARFKIISAHLKNNLLIIDEIQPAGKKPMSFNDFKRGYENSMPDFFGSIKT